MSAPRFFAERGATAPIMVPRRVTPAKAGRHGARGRRLLRPRGECIPALAGMAAARQDQAISTQLGITRRLSVETAALLQEPS